ncbi:MAG: two component transcriptional regulator, LytTR family [Bacteroidetes bacterium]|nr:two component transcriptional regulator, LytTR family [Bacteroidota bacterium]
MRHPRGYILNINCLTMEIKALVVDDEHDSRSVLSSLISGFCPKIRICAEAGGAQPAYDMVLKHKPDVVFLDIQMPGGNGFSFLKKFDEVPFEVIFVTSYDKYAIEAIRFSALDYLLKPVEVERLILSAQRLEQSLLKKQRSHRQVVNLITHMENKGIEKKMALHHNDLVSFIPLGEIAYLEGERNYTLIHTLDHSRYTSSRNLGEFEEMLESYPQFFRISKSCIVNLNHVSSYSKGEPCMLFIAGMNGFEISRRRKQELIERLKK